jgi:hypothetical protein
MKTFDENNKESLDKLYMNKLAGMSMGCRDMELYKKIIECIDNGVSNTPSNKNFLLETKIIRENSENIFEFPGKGEKLSSRQKEKIYNILKGFISALWKDQNLTHSYAKKISELYSVQSVSAD